MEMDELSASQVKPESLKMPSITAIISGFGLKSLSCETYRGIWRVQTENGYKYLKRSKLNREEIKFIHEVLEYLYRRGFGRAPRLTLNLKGEPFVQDEAGLFVLTDWQFSKELDFRILMDLRAAARFLAEFHLAGEGFEPVRTLPERTLWYGWPIKFIRRLRQLEEFEQLAQSEAERSEFSRLYLRHFNTFYRQAVYSLELLFRAPYPIVAQTDSARRSLCHHDFSGRNLLRTYDHRLFLVDFDYCLRDLKIHDIINLLVRNLKHNGWRVEVCRFILEEYQRVSSLSREEIEVMQVLLTWPQDFWQVGLQYYLEKLPWPKERFLKKLEEKVNTEPAREAFLRRFPNENGLYQINRA